MIHEQCLVVFKPDAVVKSLEGNIMNSLAVDGLEIVGAKVLGVDVALAHEHYRHLKEKPFFDELIKYITGDIHNVKRVFALVYEGENATKRIRELCGATNPEHAHPKSIRGKFGRVTTKGVMENIIHASENASEAEREIKLWFQPNELIHTLYTTKKVNKTIEVEEWD